MNARSPVVLACALILAMPPAALPQEEPPPPPPLRPAEKTYDLRAVYSIGDLLRYQIQMNLTMDLKAERADLPIPPDMKMEMKAEMLWKTVGLKPNGEGVVVLTTRKGEASLMGSGMALPEPPPVTMEMDQRGRVVKMRGLENMPGGQMFSQWMNFHQMPGMGVFLPERPVKTGDTWESEVTMFGDARGKVVSTLVGVEAVGGKETLKIKQVWSVPLDLKIDQTGQRARDADRAQMILSGTFSADSLVNILAANARLVKVVTDVNGAMEMRGPAAEQSEIGGALSMRLSGKMTMNLLSAGKVAPPRPKPGSGKGKKAR